MKAKEFKVGDKVVFKGNDREIGRYHSDFSQLLGQTGTVIEVGTSAYEAIFEGFRDKNGENVFLCWDDELVAADKGE